MYTYIKEYMNNFKPYKNGTWCYEDGILMNALWQLYLQTNNQEYRDFVLSYYNQMIDESGNIKNYKLEEYNIDNIAPGIALIDVYEYTKENKYLLAIELLRKQLLTHPRTNDGNFWHKKRYPYQVWLDGIYMGLVFYDRYGCMTNDEKIKKDVKDQLYNVYKYLYNNKNYLFYHAYDETKSMQWADKVDGKSPNVWSRSCGWLAMAYVDIMANDSELTEFVKFYFKELVSGLILHLKDGMLYQVVDKEKEEGNYLETSGSAMLGYAILKAVRLNFIEDKYLANGLKIYNTIMKTYKREENGKTHIGGICQVAGLDNERRDGSSSYYYSEKVVEDEVKGIAPLILLFNETLKVNLA